MKKTADEKKRRKKTQMEKNRKGTNQERKQSWENARKEGKESHQKRHQFIGGGNKTFIGKDI